MVEITNDFKQKHAAVVRRARAERIRAVRLESDLWYIARRAKGHGRYFVRFKEENGRIWAECKHVHGFLCNGTMRKDSSCTHIAMAVLRATEHGRKQLLAA